MAPTSSTVAVGLAASCLCLARLGFPAASASPGLAFVVPAPLARVPASSAAKFGEAAEGDATWVEPQSTGASAGSVLTAALVLGFVAQGVVRTTRTARRVRESANSRSRYLKGRWSLEEIVARLPAEWAHGRHVPYWAHKVNGYGKKNQHVPARVDMPTNFPVTDSKFELDGIAVLKAPSVSVSSSDIKRVGAYAMKGAMGEFSASATLPALNSKAEWMKDIVIQGEAAPESDEGVEFEMKKLNHPLQDAVAKQGLPMDKDFVMDRQALLDLMHWVDGALDETQRMELARNGQTATIFIVQKAGNALVVESPIKIKKEVERKLGKCQLKSPAEDPQGSRIPALLRLAMGSLTPEVTTKDYQGKHQMVRGTSGGELDRTFQFSELKVGGMSCLVRCPVHVLGEEGTIIELDHHTCKVWGNTAPKVDESANEGMPDVTQLQVLSRLLLGGPDAQMVAQETAGLISKVLKFTAADLMEKNTGLQEAFERRVGRVAMVLENIKKALKGVPDGSFALQYSCGKFLLGTPVVVMNPPRPMWTLHAPKDFRVDPYGIQQEPKENPTWYTLNPPKQYPVRKPVETMAEFQEVELEFRIAKAERRAKQNKKEQAA
mmetsp:Transcript_168440/g.541262  ORF Transcript_168440/g.541262 Transcript_168440/m.541262 type:complete len:606 (+) Transcript_168440:66-1883(+)